MIAPSRAAGMVMYRRRSRSLLGNLSSVLLQPVAFYESFPATRQWLLVATLILAVTGFSAIRQPSSAVAEPSLAVQEVVSPQISSGSGPGDLFIPPNDVSSGAPTRLRRMSARR